MAKTQKKIPIFAILLPLSAFPRLVVAKNINRNNKYS